MKKQPWLLATLAGAFGLVVARQAFAQQGDAAMRGKDIIYEIFGVDASTLASAVSTGGETGSILAAVSGVVNIVAMFAAFLIVLLTFTHAVVAQGEHGRMMGKFSSFWVPIRTVVSLGFLAPLSLGGYSLVQVLFLWLGNVGSNYADDAWTKANDYMGQNFALTQLASTPDTKAVVAGLYRMEVCAAALRQSAANGGDEYGVALNGDGASYTGRSEQLGGFLGTEIGQRTELVHSISYDGTGALMASGGVCGQMELRRPEGEGAPTKDTMERQVENITSLREGLAQLAEAHVSGQLTGGEVQAALDSEERAFARNEHLRERVFAAQIPSIANAHRQEQMQRSEAQGWVSAGAYYMTMVGLSTGLSAQLSAAPRFTPQRMEQLSPMVAEDVAPWLSRADTAVMGGKPVSRADAAPATEGSGWMASLATWFTPVGAMGRVAAAGDLTSAYDALLADFREGVLTLVNAAPQYVLSSVQDPVVTLAAFGNRMLEMLQVALAGLLVAVVALGATTGGTAAFGLLAVALPLLAAVAIPGVFLAYFLPGIPYFMWMMGVAGWMLMLVQAVTAGPLWAAAHAMPDGDGFAGSHARQGYMLLISVIARPLLMVVGLIAAMLVVRVAVRVVATTFSWFMESSTTDSAAGGVLGGVALLLIFAGLILVIVRWSFSLIHLVPDTVLRFIGGVSESLGEASVADQVKMAALAVYGVGRSMAGGVGNAFSAVGKLKGAAKAAQSVRAGGA